jgi:hypothetical protein
VPGFQIIATRQVSFGRIGSESKGLFDAIARTQFWAWLKVAHLEHSLGKQYAATALIFDLTVVTRNHNDFVSTGMRMLSPFTA